MANIPVPVVVALKEPLALFGVKLRLKAEQEEERTVQARLRWKLQVVKTDDKSTCARCDLIRDSPLDFALAEYVNRASWANGTKVRCSCSECTASQKGTLVYLQ